MRHLRRKVHLPPVILGPSRRYASNDSKSDVSKLRVPPQPAYSRHSQIPLPSGAKQEAFVPKPLSHPIGLAYPPELNQNTGLDPRTLRERHRDLTDYERHLKRRQELKTEFAKPYFRDWTNMRHAKGKSFVANERLFRGEKAGWFPNIWGDTLLDKGHATWMPNLGWSTTRVLEGKVNVVAIFSGLWAENQVKTFVDRNHELMDMLKNQSQGMLQLTRINYEDNWLRRLVVTAFKYRLRKQMRAEDWGRYFIVNKSLHNSEVRDAMGFLNSKVGYVYLIDRHCRIRWAGSGNAEPAEITSMNSCIRRLMEETEKQLDGEAKKDASAVVSKIAIAS